MHIDFYTKFYILFSNAALSWSTWSIFLIHSIVLSWLLRNPTQSCFLQCDTVQCYSMLRDVLWCSVMSTIVSLRLGFDMLCTDALKCKKRYIYIYMHSLMNAIWCHVITMISSSSSWTYAWCHNNERSCMVFCRTRDILWSAFRFDTVFLLRFSSAARNDVILKFHYLTQPSIVSQIALASKRSICGDYNLFHICMPD